MRSVVAAEGLEGEIEVDSAGTISYHAGGPADPRMRQAARDRGIELTSVARKVVPEDFERFDLVVAMDRDNLADLEAASPAAPRARLALFSEFLAPGAPLDVPDPYYGGAEGFEKVLDLIEAGCPRILEALLAD